MAQRFDPDNTITGMCNELDELIPLVQWTARSIKQIVKNSPLMSRSSFISRAQQSAFEWTTRLKGLVSDVEESKPYQEPSRAAEWTTCQWSSLYQHLQTCVCGPRAEMTQFLCIITASHFYRSFDIENARLGEFVTKLSLTWGLRNPRVDTIWVREPTGMEWFCIPLKFCETWEGFSTVIYEYCKNGPEIEYIRGGNWVIIRDTDNHIIDQMQFTSVLTPEMRLTSVLLYDLLPCWRVHARNVATRTMGAIQWMAGFVAPILNAPIYFASSSNPTTSPRNLLQARVPILGCYPPTRSVQKLFPGVEYPPGPECNTCPPSFIEC